jgi:hypothetical protein
MHVLRSPKRLIGSFLPLILVWSADLGAVMAAVFYALTSICRSRPACWSCSASTWRSPFLDARPGALELGAVAALELLHVGREPAMAFALLYHALQIVPPIAAGLILEYRLVLGREGRPAPTNGEPCAPAKLAPPEPSPKPPTTTPQPSHTRP